MQKQNLFQSQNYQFISVKQINSNLYILIIMGATHGTNYTKGLQFVQNLNDYNFGEVDIFRNEDGKFIMRSCKSFITGDKRHYDFIKILEFIKTTKNPNIISILYIEQYQQSNVCISYQKMEVYSQYLNFTFEGFIRNKKAIEEAQIWYLIKTMLHLIQQLETNQIRMNFSLNNIFLTLKGIPSVFFYHFFYMDEKNQSQSQTVNSQYQDKLQNNSQNNKKQENFLNEENEESQNINHKSYQIFLKPYCMRFCLAKIVLQLFHMKILTNQENNEISIQQINQLLLLTLTQNHKLGKIIQSLLQGTKTEQILNQIIKMEINNKIKVSTEIRFNKFRYIMTEEQKPQKNLTLNQNNLVDFSSKPITPINTPITRLRQPDNLQIQAKKSQFTKKSNRLMPQTQENFFKKKPNQKINEIKNSRKIQNSDFYTQKIQSRTKAYSIGGKSNKQNQQIERSIRTNLSRGSKLSLISKSRNLSTEKIANKQNDDSKQSVVIKSSEQNKQTDSLNKQFFSAQVQNPTKNPKLNNQYASESLSLSSIQSLKQKPSKQFKSTNKIKEILNQEIQKGKQYFQPQKKNTLLNTKITYEQSYKLSQNQSQKVKAFFKPNSNINKQSINNKQQSRPLYKAYNTQIQPQSEDQDHQQSIKPINTLQNEQHLHMKQSLNSLDTSNFLLAIELKKSRNHLKIKQLTERKDSLMLNFPAKKLSKPTTHINEKENIKQFLKQKILSKQTPSQNNKALHEIIFNQNISSGRMRESPLQKRRVKIKNDKSDVVNEKSKLTTKNKDLSQNKQNLNQNFDNSLIRSKLKKVSIRSKGQQIQ